MYSTFSEKYGCDIITIYAGEYYVTDKNEVISTVLGSCVSVTLYDPIKNIAAMNHYMLPFSSSESHIKTESSNRYGITSLNNIIRDMEKLGSNKKNMLAKVFGGGNVLSISNNSKDTVGLLNIKFAKKFLSENNIPIQAEEVGDTSGRNLSFFTLSGRAFVKKIPITEIKYLKDEFIQIS